MTRFRVILDQHYIALAGILLVEAFKVLLGEYYFQFAIDGDPEDSDYPSATMWDDSSDSSWTRTASDSPPTDTGSYEYDIGVIGDNDGGVGDYNMRYLGYADVAGDPWASTTDADLGGQKHEVWMLGQDSTYGKMNLKCISSIPDSKLDMILSDLGGLLGISLGEGIGGSEPGTDVSQLAYQVSLGGLPDGLRVRAAGPSADTTSPVYGLMSAWKNSVNPYLSIILAATFFERLGVYLQDGLDRWNDIKDSGAFEHLELDTLTEGIPHMIDGGTSQEHLLSSTVAFRNYTKQIKGWGASIDSSDGSESPIPEMFYFSPGLVGRPYDLTVFTSLMKEEKFLPAESSDALPSEISQDETKRILVIGLPLGFMTHLRSLQESCSGAFTDEKDSLIKIHVNKVDMRNDDLIFDSKTFLFDTRLFYRSTGRLDLAGGNAGGSDPTISTFTWNNSSSAREITDWVSIHEGSPSFDKDFKDDILEAISPSLPIELEQLRLTSMYGDGGVDGVFRGNIFNYNDFKSGGSAYTALGYSEELTPEESQDVFTNHISDFHLKYYLNVGMGVDMSEMGFFFDEDQVRLADPDGSLTTPESTYLNSTKAIKSFTSDFRKEMEDAVTMAPGGDGMIPNPVDQNLIDRFLRSSYRSTLFAMSAYKQRILLPRLFERTFAVLIDVEDDFDVVGGTLPEDRSAEFYAFNITIEMMLAQQDFTGADLDPDRQVKFEDT